MVLLLLVSGLMPATAWAEWRGPSEQEQELLRLIRSEKYILAREKAEKLLRRRPGSIIASYTMAMVYHDEEANLPRALYHIRLTEQRLIKRFGRRPSDPQARVWHRKILREAADILGEMDRRAPQLAVMDRADQLYRPRMDRGRIWPLMKLHRFDEATRLARKLALSSKEHERIHGLNGLIAIASEQLRPRQCFREGIKAVTATSYRSCILDYNTAEAAFAVYRFSEAERLSQKSVQASIQDCPSSAYSHLANLYLLRADFQRAMEAVKSSRKSGVQKRYRQQFEMGNTARLARLLYTLGKFHKAHDLASRILAAPDREGLSSFSKEVMKVIYSVDHHAANLAKVEALWEQASVRPLTQRPAIWAEIATLNGKAWVTRRRVARLLSGKEDHLLHLLRPYLKPMQPWTAGELIPMVGGGVMLQAIRRLRVMETMKQQTAPYFDSLETELLLRQGQTARALTLAHKALSKLPKDEVLLRGRTEALAASAAWKLGRRKLAERHFHGVLQRYPTALRILRIRLPVTVRASAGRLATLVGKTALSSRRLTTGDLGFTVRVTGDHKALRLCLEARGGRRLACTVASPRGHKKDSEARAFKEARTDEQRAALALDRFHIKVFAPRIDLTQRDINSLDGSAVRGDADEVLRGVLGKER